LGVWVYDNLHIRIFDRTRDDILYACGLSAGEAIKGAERLYTLDVM